MSVIGYIPENGDAEEGVYEIMYFAGRYLGHLCPQYCVDSAPYLKHIDCSTAPIFLTPMKCSSASDSGLGFEIEDPPAKVRLQTRRQTESTMRILTLLLGCDVGRANPDCPQSHGTCHGQECVEGRTEGRTMTLEEFHGLRGALTEPYRTMAIVSLCLGLSWSELVGLQMAGH
jgi:hypothetical protein